MVHDRVTLRSFNPHSTVLLVSAPHREKVDQAVGVVLCCIDDGVRGLVNKE